jgi:hypothetical protein
MRFYCTSSLQVWPKRQLTPADYNSSIILRLQHPSLRQLSMYPTHDAQADWHSRQQELPWHYVVRHELKNAFEENLFLEAGACTLTEQAGYHNRIKKSFCLLYGATFIAPIRDVLSPMTSFITDHTSAGSRRGGKGWFTFERIIHLSPGHAVA